MKIRLVVALVGFAIGSAFPTFAQEQNAVDPEVRQQIEAVVMKFQDAFNNRDAAALADLYKQDGIEVRSWEGAGGAMHSGRQAIEKMFTVDFASNWPKMAEQLVQLYPIGSAICEIADSDVGGWKAQEVTIYAREGDTWKRCLAYVSNNQLMH